MGRALLLLLVFVLPAAASAASLRGVVSHVTDGDTVWVRPARGGPPLHVRIDGIDAPEICQTFGPEARDALAARVLHQRVVIVTRAEDTYRRTIAHLRLGREDMGRWMVTHGYAWSYRFRRDPGPYAREEAQARGAHVGLWSVGTPQSPRDFRVHHGSCH